LALATFFSIVIIRSPLGMAFRALRDSRTYAISRGVSQFKFQLIVFASSAFFTGLAGGVYAGHFKVMGANTLNISLMLFLLCMMVVGGLGRAWGPLLGAALLMLADEILKDFVDYRNMGIGLIIVLFGMLWPRGVVGAIEGAYERLHRMMRRRQSDSDRPSRGATGD
jgi:branched-chain amino acid transport system permease protein